MTIKMKTVTLVTTVKRVRRHFPSFKYTPQKRSAPGIIPFDYTIVPDNCTTELGRWLAERISTTCREDDASICLVLLPAIELGLHFKRCVEQLTQRAELRTEEDAKYLSPDSKAGSPSSSDISGPAVVCASGTG